MQAARQPGDWAVGKLTVMKRSTQDTTSQRDTCPGHPCTLHIRSLSRPACWRVIPGTHKAVGNSAESEPATQIGCTVCMKRSLHPFWALRGSPSFLIWCAGKHVTWNRILMLVWSAGRGVTSEEAKRQQSHLRWRESSQRCTMRSEPGPRLIGPRRSVALSAWRDLCMYSALLASMLVN